MKIMKKPLIIIIFCWLSSLGCLLLENKHFIFLGLVLLLVGLFTIAKLWHGDKEINHWHNLAHRDELTNLLNRRGLLAKSMPVQYCLLLLDIDNFKRINDSQGHIIGDDVLQHLSKTLIENSRQGDICGRWGGDEFIVLLANTTVRSSKAFTERLHLKLSNTLHCPQYSISIGCADSSQSNELTKLIEYADHELLLEKTIENRK